MQNPLGGLSPKIKALFYIGRFNPFHYGHAFVLRTAIESGRDVVVLLGSCGRARSRKNPFTAGERIDMIYNWVEDAGLKTTRLFTEELHDFASDAMWIAQVQEVAEKFGYADDEIALIGSDRDESTWYLSSFPQWERVLFDEYERPPETKISATSVRQILYTAQNFDAAEVLADLSLRVPPSTAKFILNFIKTPEGQNLREEHQCAEEARAKWQHAPYEPIFVTTDAIVVQSGHVLVVERARRPGKGLWALPGGFINPNERLKKGVIRELTEETGIRLTGGKNSLELTKAILASLICDEKVFDDPARSERGRTITHAFTIKLDDTKPLPKVRGMFMPLHESGGKKIVETKQAFWLPFNEALHNSDKWFEDHHMIVETMLARLKGM